MNLNKSTIIQWFKLFIVSKSKGSFQKISFEKLELGKILFILEANLTSNYCLSNCSNNGVCNFANNSLVYKCDEYFTGALCNIDKRPCSSWPCLSKSTCIQNLTDFSFFCYCSELYYGRYCHEKVDVCKNEKCSGSGYCEEVDGKPKCKCAYLFEGEHFEIKSDQQVKIEKTVETSVVICIITVVLFWDFVIFLDCINTQKRKTF